MKNKFAIALAGLLALSSATFAADWNHGGDHRGDRGGYHQDYRSGHEYAYRGGYGYRGGGGGVYLGVNPGYYSSYVAPTPYVDPYAYTAPAPYADAYAAPYADEYVGPPPFAGALWIGGNWSYGPHGRYWVRGRWGRRR